MAVISKYTNYECSRYETLSIRLRARRCFQVFSDGSELRDALKSAIGTHNPVMSEKKRKYRRKRGMEEPRDIYFSSSKREREVYDTSDSFEEVSKFPPHAIVVQTPLRRQAITERRLTL